MFGLLKRCCRPRGRSPQEIVAAAARDAAGGERVASPVPGGWEDHAAIEAHFLRSVGEIPGYSLRRLIHRGGQGMVFEGYQQSTQRRVAIKVMQIPPRGEEAERRADRRFQREIRALADVNDPGIVTIHDSGRAGPQRFFVMELVDGESLADPGPELSRDVETVVRAVLSVARSLNAAHAKGIVHRDLKPSNIMIDADGRTRILDFGLAKFDESQGLAHPSETATLSEEGQFYGTRAWASPEQIEGASRRITPRTDVYALGVILYHLLTGRFPYAVDGPTSIVSDNILNRAPEPLRAVRKGVPRNVECIVQKCLRKSPSDRYADAGELADDLQRHLDGLPVTGGGDWLYRVKLGLRRAWKDGRVVAAAIIVVCTAVGSMGVLATGLVDPLDAWVLDRVVRSRAWLHPDIRVIALTNDCVAKLGRLAAERGISGVSPGDLYSWRSMHGALMRRLADVRPKCVTWDIRFIADVPEHDGAFVEGIQSCRAAGVPVVVGADKIGLDGKPGINTKIASAASDWGLVAAQFNVESKMILGAALIDYNPQHQQYPSLSLATDRAIRGGPAAEILSWHPLESVVSRRVLAASGAFSIEWIQYSDQIGPAPPPAAPQEFACLSLALPDPATCASATTTYRDVFEMSQEALRERFGSRLVVVGDCRQSVSEPFDRHRMRSIEGAREDFGVYMQAAAISELVSRRSLGSLGLISETGGAAVAAAIGVLLAGAFVSTKSIFYRTNASMLALVGVVALAGMIYTLSYCVPSVGSLLVACSGGCVLMAGFVAVNRRLRRMT